MTSRRKTLIGGLLVAAVAAGLWYWQTVLRHPRWNVLVVTLSATRADHLGCYGDASAATPAIDSLAARGLLFERAIAASPVSLPSHASLWTGLHPLEHGLVTGGIGRLPDDVHTLAEALNDRGYKSAALTAAYDLDSRFGLDQGFEIYYDNLGGTERSPDGLYVERPADKLVSDALTWLEQNQNETFCCWIHLNEPQLPYEPHPVDDVDSFADSPYDGEIAFVDRQLARILEFLDQQHLTERTLIVVAGDHGAALGDHGEQGSGVLLHESTLHVPLIISPPSANAAAIRVAEPVSLVDVVPTLLELLGLPVPQTLSGNSLAGALRNQPLPTRACLSMTAEPLLDNGWSPLASLTTPDWKYVRSSVPELYDLSTDPGELENLAAAQPDRLAELAAQFAELESSLQRNADANEMLTEARKRAVDWLADQDSPDAPADPTAVSLSDAKDKLSLLDNLREAQQLLAEDQAASAESILRELLATDPRFVQGWDVLGDSLAALKQTEEAIDCFQKVLKFNPRRVGTLLDLAAAQAVSERVEDCIASYKAAIAADSDSPVALHQLGLMYLNRGDEYQAEVLYAQALNRDRTYDPAICSQGDLAVQQGDGKRAVERYRTAIYINPRSTHAMVNLGVYAATNDDYENAEIYFQKALEVAPDDPLARQSLARIGMFRGRPQDTVDEFESILAINPDHYSTIISLGWLRASYPDEKILDPQRALELAEKAIALAGNRSADALDLLACAQANVGDFNQALINVNKALSLAAEIPEYPTEEIENRRYLYSKSLPFRATLVE